MNESLPPTTTKEQNLVTSGQRRINIIWEATQAMIAIFITLAIVWTSLTGSTSDELSNAFFLIIGFYFSRTNHTAIGGRGSKATDYQSYLGR